MLSVRPKVAELAFHLFSRPLHPELLFVHRSRSVERESYQARVDITDCGHVVTFTVAASALSLELPKLQDIEAALSANDDDGSRPFTLCEVATSAHQLLPTRRCLLSQSLKGSRTEDVSCRNGVSYRTHFQLESVDPKLFWMVGQQLGKGPTEGLMHAFDSSGRMALGGLSYVNIETRCRSMLIQAIHTFPDDYAIVKVESLFMLPDPK